MLVRTAGWAARFTDASTIPSFHLSSTPSLQFLSRLHRAVEGRARQRGRVLEFDEAGGGRGLPVDSVSWAGHTEGALQPVGQVGNGSEANEVVLPSFESTVRMLLMMAYDGDADAAEDFPEEKMIRKTP